MREINKKDHIIIHLTIGNASLISFIVSSLIQPHMTLL